MILVFDLYELICYLNGNEGYFPDMAKKYLGF
jgi:hypothetical protein